jgi:hypothetical protein
VDHLVTAEECAALLEYAGNNLILGDGYGGEATPHNKAETFYGFAVEGSPGPNLDPGHSLCLEVIQRARKVIQRHFRLPFLWLDYAHLVKREPVPGAEVTATHTAILYLNDGFEGGFTQFKETDFGPFRQVQPAAGKMIAFDVAKNAHAVSKLISGERYVLNMWFSTHMKIWRRHRRVLGFF